jgi:hypothetical protein
MEKLFTKMLPFPLTRCCLQTHITEFTTLEAVIRQGQHPDSPNVLYRYWDLAEIFIQPHPRETKLTLYRHILRMLLDTICDTCIALQWRQLCLDYCYKPLSKLASLAKNHKEKQKFHEQYSQFRTLTHYFF